MVAVHYWFMQSNSRMITKISTANEVSMTGARLDDCLDIMGWPRAELARRLNVSESSVRMWLGGRRSVPPALAVWLEDLVVLMSQAPSQPVGWQRDG
jgi:DNA-binding transcriptional regulator YiaG